jgi:hypothetical protein
MVIFDLTCPEGHRFEGWFTDLADLERQLAEGLLSCPVCGDTRVRRLPSVFGLVKNRQGRSRKGRGREREREQDREKGKGKASEGEPGEGGQAAEFLARLEELSDRLQEDFADVGAGFSGEALKMHFGAAPRRNIRGFSTEEEEELLRKEGVEFFKAPMLVRKRPSLD